MQTYHTGDLLIGINPPLLEINNIKLEKNKLYQNSIHPRQVLCYKLSKYVSSLRGNHRNLSCKTNFPNSIIFALSKHSDRNNLALVIFLNYSVVVKFDV